MARHTVRMLRALAFIAQFYAGMKNIAFGKESGGKMSGDPSKTMTDGKKSDTGKPGKSMTGTEKKAMSK